MEKVTTKDSKLICLECQNEIIVDSNLKIGDIVECPNCGIEYEIINKRNTEFELQLLEIEK